MSLQLGGCGVDEMGVVMVEVYKVMGVVSLLLIPSVGQVC